MTKAQRIKLPRVDALRAAATGEIPRALATSKCSPPQHIELLDGKLVYTPRMEPDFEPVEREADEDMLLSFVGLEHATPEKILAFAKRWGVLGVCEHNMSPLHAPGPACSPRVHDSGISPARWAQEGLPPGLHSLFGTFWEPIDLWREYACDCRELLEAANACREQRILTNSITRTADVLMRRPTSTDPLAWQRLVVGTRLNIIIARAGITPAVLVTPTGADFWFAFQGVAGAVAAVMLSAVAGRGFGLCAGCGRMHEPTKRPRQGEQQWCERCRARGSSRAAAAKAYRERKKQALALSEQGHSLTKIAAKMGKPASTIRGWLKSAGGSTKRR